MEYIIRAHRRELGRVLNEILQASYFRRKDKPYLRRDRRGYSHRALDTRVAFSQTRFLVPIAKAMIETLDERGITQVVGRGFGSYFLVGGILSLSPHLAGGLMREARKPYGFQQLVEGGVAKNKPVYIVDDLLAYGNSASQAVFDLRREGYRPAGLLTVFRYGGCGGESAVRRLGLDCVCLASVYRRRPRAAPSRRAAERSSSAAPNLNPTSRKERPMKRRVVRTREDATAHIPYEPALIEVPGQWIEAVVSLIDISKKHKRRGLLVTNIGPDSRAAKAGMIRGDLLLRYRQVRLDRVETLRRLTRRHSSSKVTIDAVRGDQQLRFEVPQGRLGITVSRLLGH
jgi:orotate phosphoribosyltransferase